MHRPHRTGGSGRRFQWPSCAMATASVSTCGSLARPTGRRRRAGSPPRRLGSAAPALHPRSPRVKFAKLVPVRRQGRRDGLASTPAPSPSLQARNTSCPRKTLAVRGRRCTPDAGDPDRLGSRPPDARAPRDHRRLRPAGRCDHHRSTTSHGVGDDPPHPRRHEQGAGHAAEGYASASGKVGVAIATSGPRGDEPRHRDRRRLHGLGAVHRHHRTGVLDPDGDGRLPGGRHRRHHDADHESTRSS